MLPPTTSIPNKTFIDWFLKHTKKQRKQNITLSQIIATLDRNSVYTIMLFYM